MKLDPQTHHRTSIRLAGYDYSQAGAYFITIVTFRREPLFGEVTGGEMRVNALGRLVHECWAAIPAHFPNVTVDAFVVMPNHVHGILFIHSISTVVGARHVSPLPSPLPAPLQGPLGFEPGSSLSQIVSPHFCTSKWGDGRGVLFLLLTS